MRDDVRVLFLLPGFPSNEEDENCFPYIQDFLIEIIGIIGRNNIRAIALHYPLKSAKYHWNNLPVSALGGRGKGGLKKLRGWYKAVVTMYRLYRRQEFDIIHSFWLNEPALLSQLFSFLFPVKLLVTVQGQDALKSNKYLPYLNLKKFYVVGVSDFVLIELQKYKKVGKHRTISAGIGKFNLNDSRNQIQGFDVLGVGNISPLKNFNLFVDVVQEIKKNVPDIQAAIIGRNMGELDHLLKKCEVLGLTNNLIFLGELKRSEVIQIMSKSKVFLHTSLYEGQGFVLTEALSQGMSVVTTPVADSAAIIEMHTGIGLSQLSAAVLTRLQSFERRPIILKSAKQTAVQYNDLYRELLGD